MTDLKKERELEDQIEDFKKEAMELWFVPNLADTYKNKDLFSYSIIDGEVFFMREQTRQLWSFWNKAKAQAVPDTQQKLTDTYYLEGSDYVVDCPFEYDIEIDKGEVLELQKWQRTESTKVYFANIYKDEDNFEILQFASKAEAENAVAENLKFLEASESGAEG
ncbi:hypothetical protein HA117_16700 [Acinetobacter baumannii]|uniref:hypothetical protein n=1 Tax=Acinetobacter baumannii TaxID=470 RepID=UPI0009E1280F|nr:hypothetical protein [Acinetobacter baumannii]ARG33907.1 hypothetical protein B7L46_02770 [Acinetobacter baumannii]KAA8931423.1 hypothetical protein DLI67_17600 [Acinetobacter baumannii]KAA8938117.1 hypothetical protein DLI68_08625 [Acinetobacter baumannii]MDM8378864.1 hypothetical protein [Acinetobacter baumannii]MDM8390327.1 hypothetical protein [Acinetobacter baumannii]